MVLTWILTSTFIVSLISLVGVFTLAIKDKLLERVLFYFIGFSAGALIGGAFLHILPEVLQKNNSIIVFYYLILGFVLFFMLEKYLHWRHCHEGRQCHVHTFTYLNLIGGTCHNFIDGMVIAVAFIASFKLGIATTLAIILHEIPRELGDFGVLVYGGFSKRKALICNFFSAVAAMVGSICGYFIADFTHNSSNVILPITAGGFIYIAASDLIPELHKENNLKRSSLAFLAFLSGIIFMAVAKFFLAD